MGEVAAAAGITSGGGSPGMGIRPTFVGGTGVAFSKYGMAMFETAFTSLGQHTIQGWPLAARVQHSYLFDFAVDFHIRIPVKDRWAPYLIAGAGLLWNRVSQRDRDPVTFSSARHFDQFNGALHTGGGVRYYIGEGWGIRPEVKVIVSKQIYTSASVGIFYIVPTTWP